MKPAAKHSTVVASASLVAMSFAFLLLAGCSGSGDRPNLGYVTGKIQLDGKPLPQIRVVFKAPGVRAANGATDANGDYYLVYLRDIQGVPVGEHTVKLVDMKKPDTVLGSGRVPKHYAMGKTPLTASVKPGEQVINFDLTSKPTP